MIPAGLALALAGCASPDTKPVQARGWVGGEYREAKTPSDGKEAKAGIALGALDPQSPAALAGLQTGDVILEVGGQPVSRLKDFWQRIDLSKPGTALPVKVYRGGRTLDCQLTVGRETFRHSGSLALALPTVVHGWNLWRFDHGFSVVVAGFDPDVGVRHEEGRYASDLDWNVWLAILELSSGKTIVARECAAPASAMRISGADMAQDKNSE